MHFSKCCCTLSEMLSSAHIRMHIYCVLYVVGWPQLTFRILSRRRAHKYKIKRQAALMVWQLLFKWPGCPDWFPWIGRSWELPLQSRTSRLPGTGAIGATPPQLGSKHWMATAHLDLHTIRNYTAGYTGVRIYQYYQINSLHSLPRASIFDDIH